MMQRSHIAVIFACCIASHAYAQPTQVSAPARNYLLEIAKRWGHTSPLGDLSQVAREPDDIEVRLWAGYGLGGTRGTVLRRVGGAWTAFDADVNQCPMKVTPDAAISDSVRTLLEARARIACPYDGSDGTYFAVSWLTLQPLSPLRNPAQLFDRLVDAGLLRLPPELHPSWKMIDGFTYVVEVRIGNAYRASIAPQSESARDTSDLIVREMARLLAVELPPSR